MRRLIGTSLLASAVFCGAVMACSGGDDAAPGKTDAGGNPDTGAPSDDSGGGGPDARADVTDPNDGFT